MINQKFVYSLKKAINLFMVIALMMAGVAVNVSPAQAALGDIEIIAPAEGAKIPVKDGDLLTVQFTVDSMGNPAGDGSYQIWVGEVLAGTFSATFDGTEAQPFTRQITIPTMGATNEGLQSVSVAVKFVGDSSFRPAVEQSDAVVVDNLLPAAPVLTSPVGGEVWAIGTPQSITWTATPHDDETFTLYFSPDNGANWTKIADDVTGSPLSWSPPPMVTTQALIKIEVVDDAGHTAADQSGVFTIYGVDDTVPEVEMEDPASFITGEYTLSATASDSESGIAGVLFQYSLDEGESWSVAGAGSLVGTSWQLAFNTAILPDGDVQFRAKATNGIGLSNESEPVNTVIDNSDPVIVSFNLADEDWIGLGFEFEVTASDAHSGITKMELFQFVTGAFTSLCSDTFIPSDAVKGVYTLTCDTSPNALATQIKAKVTNGVGLTAEESHTVQVDLSAPTMVAGALTTPANNAVLHLGDPLEIKWTAAAITDAHLAGIDLELRVGADVKAVIASGELNDGSYLWTVAGVPGSTYQVCLVARDLAGNTAADCNTDITIWGSDLTPPVVTLAEVETPNTGTITLSATASDPQSGIQHVEFFVKPADADDDEYSSVGLEDLVAPYIVDWITTEFEDGEYMIKTVATNGIGVTGEDEFGPVLIDNTDPWVDTLSRAGKIYKVSVSDAEGSGIASVVFGYFEDSEWVVIGAGVPNPVSGKYESPAWVNVDDVDVYAVATDNVGNFKLSDPYEPDAVIELAEGWNLISLPLIPDAPAIDDVLADLIARGSVKQVVAWPFEGDTIHEKRWNGAALQDVTEIVDGVGYWVEMSKADELSFDGVYMPEPPLTPPSYIVHRGWNLIGLLSTNPVPAEDYLGEAGIGNMRAMYAFDGEYYIPITLNDELYPQLGYWLAISVDATIYPYGVTPPVHSSI